jgi:hypothetical protein
MITCSIINLIRTMHSQTFQLILLTCSNGEFRMLCFQFFPLLFCDAKNRLTVENVPKTKS